jgi:hypothetical protein
MTRRQSVALVMVVIAVYLLAKGRYRWLAPLAFLYAWLFDGFVLLYGVLGAAFVARLIAERRLCWPLIGWPTLGLGLSLLLNPYFPNNVGFTILHIAPKLFMDDEVRVGREWYPYEPKVLLETSGLAIALVPLGVLIGLASIRQVLRDQRALLLGGVAVMFLLLYLRSRRFVESEPAFAVLFAAYMVSHHLPRWNGRSLWEWVPRAARLPLIALLLAGLTYHTINVVRVAVKNAVDNHPYDTFRASSFWLTQNTAPGERVYQTDWDDFPELFFFNSQNTYIVGLDPTYMFLEQPDRYRLWRDIGRGLVERPSRYIRDVFQARWVVTDRDHTGFIKYANEDPNMQVVFESPGSLVYIVR